MLARVIVKASLATAASILISLAFASLASPGPYGLVTGAALFMCILCPLVIAFPASAYLFWQRECLRSALASAEEANTRLTEAHRLLAERARKDAMTGLLNRETFIEEIELARDARGGALLFIDADHFKRINDNHGHQAGDTALRVIAAAIVGAVREDDIVGRFGGEEFGVFLPGADRRDASALAERIRCAVEEADFYLRGGQRVPLTVSIGAGFHRDGASMREIIREADNLLYVAKRNGRNRVVLDQVNIAA